MSDNIKQEIDEQQGGKSSLWHLVSTNAIVIPIIQRDYAQGRANDDVRQIRESFIKKIFKVLGNDSSKLELDFIYGSLERPKDIALKKVDYENFVPLDGQQRLTTLFLLHWFLALWNESDFEKMRNHFKDRFSYVTRLSSSEFCSELLERVYPQDIVTGLIEQKKNQISGLLKNEGWFHNQWEDDPTISGMLTMLDSMLSLFNDAVSHEDRASRASSFFNRLACENIDDTAITFNLLYLNRGDFHLSDELYIKMNSRGKPLSDFETFKARFESFLAKFANEKRDFSGKIDGIWAHLFWELRNNKWPKSEYKKEGQTVYYRDNTDGMMMNVIKVALANKYAILADNNDNGLDELFESQVAKKDNPNLHLTFYRYTELGVFTEISDDEISDEQEELINRNNKAVCESVYNAFSFLYDLKVSFSGKYLIDPEFMRVDEDLNNILFYGIDGKDSVIPSISYQTRLMFWALSEYCIKYKKAILNCKDKKCTALNRWMRFIRNMVESAEYNTVYDMQNALKFLDSILSSLNGNGDIIKYLSQISKIPECTPFPPSQIKEEVLKAQLISCDAALWEDSIIGADNVESWPGRSGYLLYFSGLSEKSYEVIQQWDTTTHDRYRKLYDSYKQKMDVLLSYLIDTDFKKECLFERALLSKGNYLRREDNKSIIYSMMDQSVTSRSYSFRQMIQYNGLDSNNDNSVYKEGVECLKRILDDSLYDDTSKETIEKSLRKIIKKSLNSINDWRRPLLNNKRIWHEAWDRFMWIDNDDTAWVVRRKGGSTNQYETWSYHLYLLLQLKGLRYGYYPHSYPRHTVLSFKIGKQMFQLKISHISSGEWQFDMIAIDENYQPITLDSDMRKIIFELMPNNSRTFIKKSIYDTIVWADTMQYCIEQNGELL